MYEQLMGFGYVLIIDGDNIQINDPRRNTIRDITCTLRRKESSSLTITFVDVNLYWHKVFTQKRPIKVYFKGYNLDGSAPEEFEGYVSAVEPATDLQKREITIHCLDVHPSLFNPIKVPRVFKNMSRKAILQKLASECKANLTIKEDSAYLAQKEEETTMSANDSIIKFLSDMLDEVGYKITVKGLTQWFVSPQISKNKAKFVHSNQGKDGSLLDFKPSFLPFTYEDPPSASGGDGSDAAKAADPTTKKIEEHKDTNKPENRPTSSAIKAQAEAYFDVATNAWKKVSK
jgi:hypothetical protein